MTYSYTTTVNGISTRIEAPTAHELREMVEWHEKRQVDEISYAAVDAVANETPSPAPLKWGCKVVTTNSGRCDVFSADRKHWLGMAYEPIWLPKVKPFGSGIWNDRDAALSALAACTTPPPGWEEPKP